MSAIEGLAITGALHKPLSAVYDLAKCGIEELHYRKQVQYSGEYNNLKNIILPHMINAAIPATAATEADAVLLVQDANFQGLSADEKNAVVKFLLSRETPGNDPGTTGQDLATRAGMPAGSNARNVLDPAQRQYNRLPNELKEKVDAFLVTGCDVPRAALDLDISNPLYQQEQAYIALNATAHHQHSVDRILRTHQPGSEEYEELRETNRDAWKIVHKKNRRKERIQDDKRELVKFLSQGVRVVPVLGDVVGDVIKNRLMPRYRTFDPDRLDRFVEVMTGPEAMRQAMWEMRQVMKGAEQRLKQIKDGTGTAAAPGDYYRLGSYIADVATSHLVRRKLYNMEGDFGNQVKQMRVSMRKMHTACKWYKKMIKKQMLEMVLTDKYDYDTVFKQALGTFMSKMLNEAWENEPIVKSGRFAEGSPFAG